MANGFYELGVEKLLDGTSAWTGTIKVALCDVGYVADLAADEYYDDISASYVVGTPVAIGSPVVGADGVLDGDDVVFSSLTGDEVTQLVIYKDTGNSATSPLLLYFDTVSGLPFTPNGTDVTITWSNDDDKIARI